MKTEISANDLLKFEEAYHSDRANSAIETNIQKFGLVKACQGSSKYQFRFNVKIPESKLARRADKPDNNAYTFLRVVQDILRQRGHLTTNLELSTPFMSFYDKLEKANALYNELIDTRELSAQLIRERVNWHMSNFGTFHFFREITNKYGLALAKPAKRGEHYPDDQLIIQLLRDKIAADASIFLPMNSKVEKLAKKSDLMYQVYQFLAKVYGNPPTTFTYQDEYFTPLEFKEHFLGEELENYVTVTPFDKETLLESYAYVPNLYLHDNETILHSTPAKIKEAIVKQLISGVGIWFLPESSATLEPTANILDNHYCRFPEALNLMDLPIAQRLSLGLSNFNRAMRITGALTKNNIAQQFRAEDNSGQPLLLTNQFLESHVITLILHKAFLV